MSTAKEIRRKRSAERWRKRDEYWLAWVAAGFAAGAAVHHVMV